MTKEHVFTKEEHEALRLLDDNGFAVAAFTPEELRGANPEDVQDSLISEGWDVIGYLATEPEDDEEEEA